MKQKKSIATRSPERAPRPRRPPKVQTHEVRIIGGQWKRTRLAVADKPEGPFADLGKPLLELVHELKRALELGRTLARLEQQNTPL